MRLGISLAWALHALVRRAPGCVACLGPSLVAWGVAGSGSELAGGERGGKKKEEKERKKEEKRERSRGGEKKREKKEEIWVLGFLKIETRIYSLSVFRKEFLFR